MRVLLVSLSLVLGACGHCESPSTTEPTPPDTTEPTPATEGTEPSAGASHGEPSVEPEGTGESGTDEAGSDDTGTDESGDEAGEGARADRPHAEASGAEPARPAGAEDARPGGSRPAGPGAQAAEPGAQTTTPAGTAPGARPGGAGPEAGPAGLAGRYTATLVHRTVSGPCPATPTQTGAATIEVSGSEVTMRLGRGFHCNPASACIFRGRLGNPVRLSNAGPADDEGGMYRTDLDLTGLAASGTSTYSMGVTVCRWQTSMQLRRAP